MKKNNIIKEIYKEINSFSLMCIKNKIDIYAGCASFYIFVSFIPFLVILIALIPKLPITQGDFERMLLNVIPNEYSRTVLYITSDLYESNSGALSISVIVTLWAASRGLLGITRGLNEIAGEKEIRNLIIMRIISMFYTVLLLVVMILLLVMSAFGSEIIDFAQKHIYLPERVTDIYELTNMLMPVLLAGLFLFLFVVLPAGRRTVKSQIPGAFLAAFVWWVFTRLFAFYLSTFDSYSIYGSFAVVIFVGIWLYTGMYIMFIGATLNKVWALKKGNRYEG